MEEDFIVDANDKGLSILLKREANIILASLDKDDLDYLYTKERFEETLSVVNAIENTNPSNEHEINFILNTINRIWNVGLLSPLTLKEDEFLNYADEKGCFHNGRYCDIYVDNDIDKSICNDNAFNIYIRATYLHEGMTQIHSTNELVHKNHRVYLSKGGIVTGEYIEKCIIRKELVDKHAFTIQSIPNIPVSMIVDKYDSIYVVDHREPKLKALRDFYKVPVNIDNVIANRNYNIRKYVKLK